MKKQYKPFKDFGPGDIIKDNLEALNWTQQDLADVMGMNPKSINELLNNKTSITFETARLLGKAFNQSPQFWINLDTNYRLRMGKNNVRIKDTQIRSDIYRHMPINEMISKGWLKPYTDLAHLSVMVKKFWGMDSLDFSFLEREVLPNFRKSESFSQFQRYNALTWMQKVRLCAARIKVKAYNSKELKGLSKDLYSYTMDRKGIIKFITRLNDCGVKFFVLSHLPKTYVDGASFLDGKNPVIVCTARHNRVDNFWFTIAHEIAHILLHIKKEKDIFIDNLEGLDSDIEKEANEYALELIKAKEILNYFEPFGNYISTKRVENCSQELGIGRSIIVGVLQYNGILEKRNLNRFKEKVVPLIPGELVMG